MLIKGIMSVCIDHSQVSMYGCPFGDFENGSFSGIEFGSRLVTLMSSSSPAPSGSSREVKAPGDVSERMLRKLRGKSEFTILLTLKQEHLNSGVILSIHHADHRYCSSH